jgi:hypothetical protein
MPAIGDREIPATNVDTAVDYAKKIAQQFKGAPFDRKALATALGYKSDGTGAFNQMLADLRRFGIITGRGESITATELVQRLAVPRNDEEYGVAVLEAMNKVTLFNELYNHYKGVVPSEDDLLATLINVTKADRVHVSNVVGRVRSNLATGWAKSGAFRSSVSAGAGGNHRPSDEAPVDDDVIVLTAGKLHLRYPLTADGIEMMRLNFDGSKFWEILSRQVKGDDPPATPEKKGP